MKARITIQKLKKSYKGKPLYRITKLVNSKRINLLDTDYEEDELKQLHSESVKESKGCAVYEYEVPFGSEKVHHSILITSEISDNDKKFINNCSDKINVKIDLLNKKFYGEHFFSYGLKNN